MLAFIPFGAPGMGEMLVIGVIMLLLFGKRLPEVARSLGKGLVEFKRGVSGIEDEVNRAVYTEDTSSTSSRPIPAEEQDEELTAPKFEPPPVPSASADEEKSEQQA